MYFCAQMEITTTGSPYRIPCLLHLPEKILWRRPAFVLSKDGIIAHPAVRGM